MLGASLSTKDNFTLYEVYTNLFSKNVCVAFTMYQPRKSADGRGQ
jgi:hypothetical protein